MATKKTKAREHKLSLTAATFAKYLGVSLRQLNNYVNEGMPRSGRGRKSRYGSDAMDWYVGKKIEEANPPAGVDDLNLREQQARKTAADAEMAELRLKLRKGQLAEIKEVKRLQVQAYSVIRSKILSWPSKVTPRLAAYGNMSKVKAILEQETNELLTELVHVSGNIR